MVVAFVAVEEVLNKYDELKIQYSILITMLVFNSTYSKEIFHVLQPVHLEVIKKEAVLRIFSDGTG